MQDLNTLDPVPVFHARGLRKTYVMGEVAVHALRDVDLDIYERELIVLLGPSGSGKSTLLNILGGVPVANLIRLARGNESAESSAR